MSSVSNGTHQGPILGRRVEVIIKPEAPARERLEKKRHAKKQQSTVEETELDRKRRKAREYYHANKDRLRAEKKEAYHQQKGGGKTLRVIPSGDNPSAVPKRPSRIDALVCINRSLKFLGEGDTDGAELWSRFAARIIQGKE